MQIIARWGPFLCRLHLLSTYNSPSLAGILTLPQRPLRALQLFTGILTKHEELSNWRTYSVRQQNLLSAAAAAGISLESAVIVSMNTLAPRPAQAK